ncbi:MAG: hypothetical protein U9R23_01455 [Candidatus Cloacimonadota bacterium]|nr:hypothetical protein [Candidatus Cloacimonadota bacterium]
METTLATILLKMKDSISQVLFLLLVLLIIGIILWNYVVKNRRLLSELDKKLNDINYMVADLSENVKNDNKELDKEDQSDK